MTAAKYTKHAKGQVQMNETMLVLFIIVLIIIVGMIVYYRFSIERLKGISEELSEQEASVLLASISRLKEIGCSNEECIDTSKLIPFYRISSENREFYRGILGYKRIIVEQLYPVISSNEECTASKYNQVDYPNNCGYWVVYDEKPIKINKAIKISTPISLYFPEDDKYGIGRLEIEVYR